LVKLFLDDIMNEYIRFRDKLVKIPNKKTCQNL